MVTRTAGEKGHNYMAMKIISKDRVVKTRQIEHTFNEKNILFAMDSRFIVKLYDYFCDSKSIYMNLEFINGGEMFTHIQKQKKRRFTGDVVRRMLGCGRAGHAFAERETAQGCGWRARPSPKATRCARGAGPLLCSGDGARVRVPAQPRYYFPGSEAGEHAD